MEIFLKFSSITSNRNWGKFYQKSIRPKLKFSLSKIGLIGPVIVKIFNISKISQKSHKVIAARIFKLSGLTKYSFLLTFVENYFRNHKCI